MFQQKQRQDKGPVELNDGEKTIKNELVKLLNDIRELIQSGKDITREDVLNLGEKAATLHQSLAKRGIAVTHHSYMIKNRGIKPDDPNFYNHIHPVEDLLKFINDQNANDDPEDITLDCSFKFAIYCRRWGHKDSYKLIRIKNGWVVSYLSRKITCGRDGRVAAEPGTGLFEILDNDCINYPEDLHGYVEWIWIRANEDGLSEEEVQNALTGLADWVTLVERNTPRGIFDDFK